MIDIMFGWNNVFKEEILGGNFYLKHKNKILLACNFCWLKMFLEINVKLNKVKAILIIFNKLDNYYFKSLR